MRVANTGISGVVDAHGQNIRHFGVGVCGSIKCYLLLLAAPTLLADLALNTWDANLDKFHICLCHSKARTLKPQPNRCYDNIVNRITGEFDKYLIF